MARMEKPSNPPASTGLIQWTDGYEVQPNQKKEMTNVHAPTMHNSSRLSGSGGSGALSLIYRWYRGSTKMR